MRKARHFSRASRLSSFEPLYVPLTLVIECQGLRQARVAVKNDGNHETPPYQYQTQRKAAASDANTSKPLAKLLHDAVGIHVGLLDSSL